MAIEDGVILARAFAAEADVKPAFARYEKARIERTAIVHAQSVEQGRLTHARDPDNHDATAAPATNDLIIGYAPVRVPI